MSDFPQIVITVTLDDYWATAEVLASMSDDEIIELARDDISSMLEGSSWQVVR